MPKKPAQREQEVIGQIFDFIFKEAKKKPDKRKPIKLSGLDGKSILTDSLVAALERPGVFLTEQAAKDLNDALDITLTKFRPDEANPVPSTKISLSNAINIIKDPMGTFQKAKDTADAMRKSSRAKFAGQFMRELVTNGWARKYADIDTQEAVRLGLVAQSMSQKDQTLTKFKNTWDIQAGLGQSASGRGSGDVASLTNMQERAATLIGRGVFTERDWNNMSEDQRSRFGQIWGRGQNLKPRYDSRTGSENFMNIDYVKDQFRSELTSLGYDARSVSTIMDRYDRFIIKVNSDANGKLKEKSISLSDPNFYRNLELNNIDTRIAILTSRKASLTGQAQVDLDNQIDTLKKSRLVINAQDLDGTKVLAARNQIQTWISSTQSQINAERDPVKRADLRRKLKGLASDRRELDSLAFWDSVGTVEGYWGSLKALSDGDLLKNILNGDFFDPKKNDAFCPSIEWESPYGQKIFIPRGLAKYKLDKNGNIAKDANGNPLYTTGSLLKTAHNKFLTQIYYFTPRSWMRTLLYNGEGFAYLTYMRNMQTSDLIRRAVESANLGSNGTSAALLKSLQGGLGDDYLTQIIEGRSAQAIADILNKSGLQGQALKELKDKLEKNIGSIQRFGKLHQVFSLNARLKDAITKRFENFMIKRRAAIIKAFMQREGFKKFFSGAAGKLLGQWIQKGGLQSIARALVVGLANALGFATTGGAANLLITAVAMVLTDVLFAIGKVLFGIVVFAFFGFIGIFFLMFTNQKTFNQSTYTYASTPPGEVVYNPNYIDYDYIIGGGEPGAPGTIYTGDIQAIYDQVAAEMGLSTKLHLVTCTDGNDGADEGPCNMIDWAWCYSGVEIYCKADKLAQASDAGLTNLFRHELVHQIQRGGGSLLREWGADFLSNNGGGYRFITSSGSIQRATETASYLVGSGVCTYSQLEELAVAPGGGTPCGSLLVSYIKNFASR